MSAIKDQILEDFYKKLLAQPGIVARHVAELRALLDGAKKPKAAEIAKVLVEREEGSE